MAITRLDGRAPPLNALRAFEAAARHLSFKKAAGELHVTPGAVSHQVKLLEDHVGTPLFRRLTRALELTPEAAAMLPKVREGLESLYAAVQRGRSRHETRPLTVVSPPNFAARWLMPRLGRFAAAHPEIELHLASRQAMVDTGAPPGQVATHAESSETPVAMVRFGSGHYPGNRVDEVFSAVYVPACSPRLLGGKHPLRSPGDLRHHTLLHDDTVNEESSRPKWTDWLRSAGVKDIDGTRGPHFSDAALAMDAAIEGMGVTLAIKSLLDAEVRAKRLVVPFPLAAPGGFSYYLVTPDAATGDATLETFRGWLLSESAEARAS